MGGRSRGVLGMLLAGLLLLAGCGQGRAATQPGAGPSETGTTDPASLELVDWQLVELVQDDQVREVAGVDAVLRFDGTGHVQGEGCNYFGATVDIRSAADTGSGSGELRAGGFASTQIGCSDLRGELDSVTMQALQAGATWTVRDGRLRIRGANVELVYRPRDVLFPTRDVTALVQGERGGAVWRLSWHAAGRSVGVTWESRDRPGTRFASSGIGREVDFPVTHLEPSVAHVAGQSFVFVAVPAGTAAAQFLPPGGGRSVPLTAHPVPPAKTWSLFAGFIGPQTRGGHVVSYDAAGQILLRSHTLPS